MVLANPEWESERARRVAAAAAAGLPQNWQANRSSGWHCKKLAGGYRGVIKPRRGGQPYDDATPGPFCWAIFGETRGAVTGWHGAETPAAAAAAAAAAAEQAGQPAAVRDAARKADLAWDAYLAAWNAYVAAAAESQRIAAEWAACPRRDGE